MFHFSSFGDREGPANRHCTCGRVWRISCNHKALVPIGWQVQFLLLHQLGHCLIPFRHYLLDPPLDIVLGVGNTIRNCQFKAISCLNMKETPIFEQQWSLLHHYTERLSHHHFHYDSDQPLFSWLTSERPCWITLDPGFWVTRGGSPTLISTIKPYSGASSRDGTEMGGLRSCEDGILGGLQPLTI